MKNHRYKKAAIRGRELDSWVEGGHALKTIYEWNDGWIRLCDNLPFILKPRRSNKNEPCKKCKSL